MRNETACASRLPVYAMSEAFRPVADITSFATLGAVTVAQECARAVLGTIEGADPQVVVEETLALVAVATARAFSEGFSGSDEMRQAVGDVVLRIPLAYRDYLAGIEMLNAEGSGLGSIPDVSTAIGERVGRKLSFYAAHLPDGSFPTQRMLAEKMELWMGRVSPPRLPDSPSARLDRLELVPVLRTHMRLVRAYARKASV